MKLLKTAWEISTSVPFSAGLMKIPFIGPKLYLCGWRRWYNLDSTRVINTSRVKYCSLIWFLCQPQPTLHTTVQYSTVQYSTVHTVHINIFYWIIYLTSEAHHHDVKHKAGLHRMVFKLKSDFTLPSSDISQTSQKWVDNVYGVLSEGAALALQETMDFHVGSQTVSVGKSHCGGRQLSKLKNVAECWRAESLYWELVINTETLQSPASHQLGAGVPSN